MTKKRFLKIGLFLIALGPLIMAIQTYLLIQHGIKPDLLPTLFNFPGIPVIFCCLLWQRLRHIGKSRKMIVLCTAGYMALLWAGVASSIEVFTAMSPFFPSGLGVEAAEWSKAGGHGEFRASLQLTLKFMAFNTFLSTVLTWPYIVALYLGAQDPRKPSRLNILSQYAKRTKDKLNTVTNAANQKLA